MGKLTAASLLALIRSRALPTGGSKKHGGAAAAAAATIGVLAFEVAGLMSKTAYLWHSLADDDRIRRLRDETLRLEGVRKLVSDDDDFLLGLALAEIADTLASLSRSVARLGKRCADPALRRFDLVFADLVKSGGGGGVDLGFSGRKMDRKVRKMERLAAATANLYQELEVLAELEQGLRRIQRGGTATNPAIQGSLTECRHRVAWQRHEVKCLRESSLWGRSYDYTVRLLARSIFAIVARIKHVFGFQAVDSRASSAVLPRSQSVAAALMRSVHPSYGDRLTRFSSGPLQKLGTRSGPIYAAGRAIDGQCTPGSGILPPLTPGRRPGSRTKWTVSGRPFGGCVAGGNDSPVLESCIPRLNAVSGIVNEAEEDAGSEAYFYDNASTMNLSMYLFDSKRKLLNAPPSTLGAAALALHYANVIIVIEKLVASPHLIGPDARDDLYYMLPTSIRAALRARLKSYAKNLALSVYDPVLVTEWSEAVARILEWLAPLAHNMIKWQSERNFEQQHLISTTNVLLLQTLYFANQTKTEAAITELLVGLNYMWRFGRELNAKAIHECISSRNFDDYLDSKGY